ncbi:hypothetical protein [uncultured Sulfitobacter sp.]|uniref:hypothetical protein n=1 Tax=uncultured Sulfitobacter sp. TaxID=191468 RepID=UPI002623D81F|nr:hypothetical protein [uncultured Sulfitobacter sp.]
MSNLKDLKTMQQVVEIKYRQQQESFARLMVQENRLRASLTQLDQQMADSRASKDSPQKAIGADVLWQAWIGRKKRELNMQLAQVLAVKERHISQVRHAYGKVLVTQTLVDETHTKAQQKMAQSQLDRAISSMLF